jgi:hypothetical protein
MPVEVESAEEVNLKSWMLMRRRRMLRAMRYPA